MINIGIGIPTPENAPASFAIGNLTAIIGHTRNHLKDLGNIFVSYQSGVRTDRNRNLILSRFLEQDGTENQIDYVLWLDADMIYPASIICDYLEGDFDVMGCMYFKRTEPFSTVAYTKGNDPYRPYHAINPLTIEHGKVYEVDGLGYGGLMVNMKVYRALKEAKWTKYGSNFHLPYESIDNQTHDLDFCKVVQNLGYKIMLHGSVRPGHIAEYVVTELDWRRENKQRVSDHFKGVVKSEAPKVCVVIPSVNKNPNKKLVDLLVSRSGLSPESVNVIHEVDSKKTGYHATCNRVFAREGAFYDYFVFLADDVFPGRNWLLNGLAAMKSQQAGLCIPNDGKWEGSIATFSIVETDFINEHGWQSPEIPQRLPFNECYKSNFGDMELTIIAKSLDKAVYEPSCVLTEVDFDKDTKPGHHDDRVMFESRRLDGFGGRVKDQQLLDAYKQ